VIPSQELAAAWRLTRPRQWPILSAQFAVGIALSLPPGPALPIALGTIDWLPLAAGWLAWVVMLNGGTLAYNSAWDRDKEAVAYLRRPPAPPAWLARASLLFMTAGAALGAWLVGPGFGLVTALCVALSAAYSHPRPRWKGRPGLDLLTNMLGYGAGTTAAGLLTGRAALPAGIPAAGPEAALHCLGFGLLFGSFYPLTQIYQMDADRARGDRTLSTRLGATRALGLALALGLGALAATQAALGVAGRGHHGRWLPAGALFLWLVHLWLWRARAQGMDAGAHERGMYRALALWALVDVALVAAWLV
jgi:4-hydroxybenzoate polyprenyltransferase